MINTEYQPPAEYAFYEGQPFDDLTGVPEGDMGDCSCGGQFVPIPGQQHFDADSHASIGTVCDNPDCSIQSAFYWCWTEDPPAENEWYDPEDPEEY